MVYLQLGKTSIYKTPPPSTNLYLHQTPFACSFFQSQRRARESVEAFHRVVVPGAAPRTREKQKGLSDVPNSMVDHLTSNGFSKLWVP